MEECSHESNSTDTCEWSLGQAEQVLFSCFSSKVIVFPGDSCESSDWSLGHVFMLFSCCHVFLIVFWPVQDYYKWPPLGISHVILYPLCRAVSVTEKENYVCIFLIPFNSTYLAGTMLYAWSTGESSCSFLLNPHLLRSPQCSSKIRQWTIQD